VLAPCLFLPYYLFRMSNSTSIASTHFLRTIRNVCTRLKHYATRHSASTFFFLCSFVYKSFFVSTSKVSLQSALVSFRHPYFSLLSFGGGFSILSRNKYTYFKLLKNNNFLVTNTFGKRVHQSISNSFVFV